VEIYDFERGCAGVGVTAKFRNGETALLFLDHLVSLGISQAALSNYASHLLAVLRMIDFDLPKATRNDVKLVVAKINDRKDWRESTKHHKRVVLRKLIQFVKCGSCEGGTPLPPEVS